MNREHLLRHRQANRLQTLLLVVVSCALLGGLALILFGRGAALVALAIPVVLWLLTPRVSPALVLRAYRARRLEHTEAPSLFAVVDQLARRAQLKRTPELYYLPSDVMNAFTVGSKSHAAIAISDGLLRRLPFDELAAVLAHETAHVQAGDTRLMGFADLVNRLTNSLASIGQFLLLVNLPLLLFGQSQFSWWAILLLLLGPGAATLAQLALSRTREFDADREAAELLGDPRPLARALERLEEHQTGLLRRMLGPGVRLPDPSVLRTHPHTSERVQRLHSLIEEQAIAAVASPIPAARRPATKAAFVAPIPYTPRWHRTATWF